MKREFSAGGVVFRRAGRDEDDSDCQVALIQPRGKHVWALPKGHPNPGESLEACAQREVEEETGLRTELEAPLGEIRYFYQFGKERVLKSVTFFLLRYTAGIIDQLHESMRQEVDTAAWVALAKAERQLAYRGEREMMGKAVAYLEARKA